MDTTFTIWTLLSLFGLPCNFVGDSTKIDVELGNKQLKKTLKIFVAVFNSTTTKAVEEVISKFSKNVFDVGSEGENADSSEL